MFVIEYLEMYLLVVLCNRTQPLPSLDLSLSMNRCLDSSLGLNKTERLKWTRNSFTIITVIISDVELSQFDYHGCQ